MSVETSEDGDTSAVGRVTARTRSTKNVKAERARVCLVTDESS